MFHEKPNKTLREARNFVSLYYWDNFWYVYGLLLHFSLLFYSFLVWVLGLFLGSFSRYFGFVVFFFCVFVSAKVRRKAFLASMFGAWMESSKFVRNWNNVRHSHWLPFSYLAIQKRAYVADSHTRIAAMLKVCRFKSFPFLLTLPSKPFPVFCSKTNTECQFHWVVSSSSKSESMYSVDVSCITGQERTHSTTPPLSRPLSPFLSVSVSASDRTTGVRIISRKISTCGVTRSHRIASHGGKLLHTDINY